MRVRKNEQSNPHSWNHVSVLNLQKSNWGWSGGAMVQGKLPVPGRPTNLN